LQKKKYDSLQNKRKTNIRAEDGKIKNGTGILRKDVNVTDLVK
jgi:hypothetical protein